MLSSFSCASNPSTESSSFSFPAMRENVMGTRTPIVSLPALSCKFASMGASSAPGNANVHTAHESTRAVNMKFFIVAADLAGCSLC